MSVQCSTDVGFYQVRLPPPSTSQFLRQIDSDHPWSEASRRIIKSCWFHADFQMDLLLPGILARLPKSWGFSCQAFAILAGHIFCHLVAYFKSFHCIFQAMEAWNVVDINGDIEASKRRRHLKASAKSWQLTQWAGHQISQSLGGQERICWLLLAILSCFFLRKVLE